MEITAVTPYPLSTPIEVPCWTAQERFDTAKLVLVEVETDGGPTGYGEIRGSPQGPIVDYVETFAEVAIGRDARGIRDLHDTMVRATTPRPGGIGGWDDLPAPVPRGDRAAALSAIAGIDIALWDVKGKAAGQPVYRLLGGSASEVFVYGTGGFYTETEPLDDAADELAGFVDDGYDAVKMKSGALALEDEITRVRRARESIGSGVDLHLDVNAPFDVEACIEFAAAVGDVDVGWLEEPLHWYLGPADFRRVADVSPIPLAHGEREWHRYAVRDFVDSGAIRYVQFDGTRFSGFTEALRVAEYAAQANVRIAPHEAPHVHGHLVSAFEADAYGAEVIAAEGFRPILDAIYDGGPTVEDGRLHLPDAPGFGLDVDRDAVDDLLVADLV